MARPGTPQADRAGRAAGIKARAPYLVDYFRTRAAGRIVILDGNTLTIRATWWQRLFYRKVKYGKLKGQRIPAEAAIPLAAIAAARWRTGSGPVRSRLLIAAPGLGDRWCWRGLRGGERAHRLRAYRHGHQGIGWIAMGIWWVREDLSPGRPAGFPKLTAAPAAAPAGGRLRSARQDMRGRKRRVTDAAPRRDTAGNPIPRPTRWGGRSVQASQLEAGRRKRRR